jgi:hypothetical protein
MSEVTGKNQCCVTKSPKQGVPCPTPQLVRLSLPDGVVVHNNMYIDSVFHADSKYVICFDRKREYANKIDPTSP